MAICRDCHQEMLDGAGCTVGYDGEKRRLRIPFGQEAWTAHSPALDGPCHDCGVSAGDFHHPGCDMEKCPACGQQRISCLCDPAPRWQCPACKADLASTSVVEVSSGVTSWNVWSQSAGRWDIGEEDSGEGDAWYLECGTCHERLPEELGQAFWDEMEKAWAGQ